MRRILGLTLSLVILATSLSIARSTTRVRPGPAESAPARPADSDDRVQIEAALNRAIEANAEHVVPFLIYDIGISRIDFDHSGNWAAVWLEQFDPQTGSRIVAEPGLALAYFDGRLWQIILQNEPEWSDVLVNMPPDILPAENKAIWLERYQASGSESAPAAALGGYLLPWAEGQSLLLGRSIGHGGTGYYAFDFNTVPTSIFPLYASKSGTVHKAVWTYANGFDDGNCAHSNYIILEDTTTSPVTYQLYLHLAFESIPQDLRVIGTPVVQGQYIGDADDTGCSTGHHIHYHVHANPSWYWGTALDITFDDVAINGGRPRSPIEANDPSCTPAPCQGQWYYTSQNTITDDITPPNGGLFDPQTGTVVGQQTLFMDGWATDDDSGVDAAYFMANYGAGWQQISPNLSGLTFNYTWDLCTSGVPDGPVDIALTVKDQQGNQANLLDIRHVVKQYACAPPPPACSVTANQVAIFSQANFAGTCQALSAGSHLLSESSQGLLARPYNRVTVNQVLGAADVGSVMVGSNMLVTLYRGIFAGRAQTFDENDRNLDGDWVGEQDLALAYVAQKNDLLFGPPVPAWPDGQTISQQSSLSLNWTEGGGGLEYQARLTGPGGTALSAWLTRPVWNLGSLAPGSYSFDVKSRNDADESLFGSTGSFTVTADASSPTPVSAPWAETFEFGDAGWSSTGLWNLLDNDPAAHSGQFAYWYGGPPSDFANGNYEIGGLPNSGSLTSPPVTIPAGGPYYLRFWSWYQTEAADNNWDQRWLQISANGGPYTNLYQFWDDPAGYWMQSPFIDLSAYASQTIQLRFHFETLDGLNNTYQGWLIDDVTIDTGAPPGCTAAAEPNDSAAQATPISAGTTIGGEICPPGDRDFFRFSGSAGDRIGIDLDAKALGSNLDPYAFLLDVDGDSILAENDDEAPGSLDSFITTVLPANGTYYVKLKAWDHPRAGSASHWYTMTLASDNTRPLISALIPQGSLSGNTYLATSQPVSLAVSDAGSGVAKVEFFYHSNDWANGDWISLGIDSDGSDGWSVIWDTTGLPEQLGMGLYARAYDQAGNTAVAAAWNLGIDRTAPVTTLQPLPSQLLTTAILLQWTSVDDTAPIRHYDIRQKINSGSWVTILSQVDPAVNQVWIVGTFGDTYTFQVRAVDEAGNLEPYNNGSNQANTSIKAGCSPDVWEVDDGAPIANPISEPQIHNFCNPIDPMDPDEQDWVEFQVESGKSYRIAVAPLDPSSAAVIELYDSDGTTLIDSADPLDSLVDPQGPTTPFGLPTILFWEADGDKTVYVRTVHAVAGVAGDVVLYELRAGEFFPLFLPVISR